MKWFLEFIPGKIEFICGIVAGLQQIWKAILSAVGVHVTNTAKGNRYP